MKHVARFFVKDPNGQKFSVEAELAFLEKTWLEWKKSSKREELVPIKVLTGSEIKNLYVELATLEKAIKQLKVLTVDIVENSISLTQKISLLGIDIDKYLYNYSKDYIGKDYLPLKGWKDEINAAYFYLSKRTNNNVFLVGGELIGKSTIVAEIVRQINALEAPRNFRGKIVYQLILENLEALLETKQGEYLIELIKSIILKNKDKVIIYIDNVYPLENNKLYELFVFLIKAGIRMVSCIRPELLEGFENDLNISKYVNFIHLQEPELDELEDMISDYVNHLSQKYKVEVSVSMMKFAIFTSDLFFKKFFNPGRTIKVIEDSILSARINGRSYVDKMDILAQLLEKRTTMSGINTLITAYHELGHYLVYYSLNMEIKIACVSIIPSDSYFGVNIVYKEKENDIYMTREYLINEIAYLLGGRVGEKQLTQQTSAGASRDLEMANQKAEDIILKYGLSEQQQLMNRCGYNLLTDELKNMVNLEVETILQEAYEKAEKIIKENCGLLEFLVNWIIEEKVLTNEELIKLIGLYNGEGRD